MLDQNSQLSKFAKEALFQVLLHILVLIFYAIDRDNPGIELWETIFFLNLAFWAATINYILLPRFFYAKKYLSFAVLLLLAVALALCMEEFVLEKIFFPDTRGKGFPGVFLTLLNILPVIAILVGLKFAWDAFRKQQEVEKLKLAVKESELQYLKSQINPHFLFNNLNNLYAYAIENNPKTPAIILELSNVLRYFLYDCKARYVSLGKEIEQLKNFIRISEMQVEDRGSITYSFEQLDESLEIAPLILVVFIENAFKHSTASMTDNIELSVKASMEAEGILHFSCTNSYSEESNLRDLPGGIGLENVRKRLDLLYPGKFKLDIQKRDMKFHVKLIIDLR